MQPLPKVRGFPSCENEHQKRCAVPSMQSDHENHEQRPVGDRGFPEMHAHGAHAHSVRADAKVVNESTRSKGYKSKYWLYTLNLHSYMSVIYQ